MKKMLFIPIIFIAFSCSQGTSSAEHKEEASVEEALDDPCRTNCINQRNDCLDAGGNTQTCDDLYDECVGRCD